MRDPQSPASKKTPSCPVKRFVEPTAAKGKMTNASAPFMRDHGGEMLSVPVWMLNDSKFKRSFPSPKNTYIVHYVMCSDIQFFQHFVAIYGTDTCALQLNEEQLAMCQALWKEHGSRMVPSYRTGYSTDPFASIDLAGKPKKRRKRASDPLNKPASRSPCTSNIRTWFRTGPCPGSTEGMYTHAQTCRDNTSLRPPVSLHITPLPFSPQRWQRLLTN